MLRFSAIILIFLAVAAQDGRAASSIDPTLPKDGLPYAPSVIRGQFDHAINDINALGSLNAGVSAPSNPTNGTLWLDTPQSATVYLLKIWDGNAWQTIAGLDAVNHIWMPPIGGGLLPDLLSATTVDLGSVAQAALNITGANQIQSYGSSAPEGVLKVINFVSTPTLVNSSILQLPMGANITQMAGGVEIAMALGGGSWKVIYDSVVGGPLAGVQPVRDFGAVCNGVADDTVALQAAISWAAANAGTILLPAATCKFTSELTAPAASNWGIAGVGPGPSDLKYTGATTSTDLLHFGVVGIGSNGVLLRNFRVTSSTVMTGGCALYVGQFKDSWVLDTATDDQFNSPGKNLWNGYCVTTDNGLWFDHYNAYIQNDGVQVYSTGSTSGTVALDTYFSHGRVIGGASGIHLSAVGGFEVASSDILENNYNLVIDNALSTNPTSSQVRVNESTYLDSAGVDNILINQTVQPTSCEMMFDGWVSAAAAVGIHIQNATNTCTITIDGKDVMYNQIGIKIDNKNYSILNIMGNVHTNVFGVDCLLTNSIIRVSPGSVHDNYVSAGQTQNIATNCADTTTSANFTAASTVTGTTSGSLVMMGLAMPLSIQASHTATVTISGTGANSMSGDGCSIGMAYGTGTPPINGAAAAGTPLGYFQDLTSPSNDAPEPFSITYSVANLAENAAYWFDGTMAALVGGTCTPSKVMMTVQELH